MLLGVVAKCVKIQNQIVRFITSMKTFNRLDMACPTMTGEGDRMLLRKLKVRTPGDGFSIRCRWSQLCRYFKIQESGVEATWPVICILIHIVDTKIFERKR